MPFTALNDVYSLARRIEDVWGVSGVGNLFKPGTLAGGTPDYEQFSRGTQPYNTDWNNVAPSVGFAWTPTAKDGLFKRMMVRTATRCCAPASPWRSAGRA